MSHHLKWEKYSTNHFKIITFKNNTKVENCSKRQEPSQTIKKSFVFPMIVCPSADIHAELHQ